MNEHLHRRASGAAHVRGLALFRFGLGAAFGPSMLLLVPPSLSAQIIADPSAPAAQRPVILQTGNGVPLVNIQTPSAAGVSRNTYRQFDVQGNGVVLNNVRSNAATTQIGGYVGPNPYLATGAARVILNEVNSSNPSYLNGPTEVAGQRAEVIVANPSGIRVNGGSFINASGVTLTTGTPVLASGNLDSFRVTKGMVQVEGLGLDTRTADYIVRRADAVKNPVTRAMMPIVALLATGRTDAETLEKQALHGTPILWSPERKRLKNPVLSEFTPRIWAAAMKAVTDDDVLRTQTYRQPLVIEDGRARLIYEDRNATSEEKFRIHLTLRVYKRREQAGLLSSDSNTSIDCNYVSPAPLLEAEWAMDAYMPLRTELASALARCEQQVIRALPTLLERSAQPLSKP